MSSIIIIEIILVLIIIIIQTQQGWSSNKKIKLFKNSIPDNDCYKINLYLIPLYDLFTFEPSIILKKLKEYDINDGILTHNNTNNKYENNDLVEDQNSYLDEEINAEVDIEVENEHQNNDDLRKNTLNEISLIDLKNYDGELFNDITMSLNVYLLRNKGAVADFNLVKDIVERNINSEDENLGQTVTIPLYLGLMGTMVGIVFGLMNLFIFYEVGKDLDIQGFLAGVSIAMFASFYGLGWTVYNSNKKLRDARVIIDRLKNKFYTFIQTELLPLLNQNVSSNIYTLNANLSKFNVDFSSNLENLSGLFEKNYDALKSQANILDSLEKIDITSFAKANVSILEKLDSSIKNISKFNEYLNSLNEIVWGTRELSNSFRELLKRTNNFETLAIKIENNIEINANLIQFINSHISELQERGKLIQSSVELFEDQILKALNNLDESSKTKFDSINKVQNIAEDQIIKALDQFSDFTKQKLDSIMNLEQKQVESLINHFDQNLDVFSKLSLLNDLNDSLNEIKSNSKNQISSIKQEINIINEKIHSTNQYLKSIDGKTKGRRDSKIKLLFKKIFRIKGKSQPKE